LRSVFAWSKLTGLDWKAVRFIIEGYYSVGCQFGIGREKWLWIIPEWPIHRRTAFRDFRLIGNQKNDDSTGDSLLSDIGTESDLGTESNLEDSPGVGLTSQLGNSDHDQEAGGSKVGLHNRFSKMEVG